MTNENAQNAAPVDGNCSAMIVRKGALVGTEFGEGEVVAVTKEWVIVAITKRGEVALHREDSPVWEVLTEHEISGGDESFDASKLQDDYEADFE